MKLVAIASMSKRMGILPKRFVAVTNLVYLCLKELFFSFFSPSDYYGC